MKTLVGVAIAIFLIGCGQAPSDLGPEPARVVITADTLHLLPGETEDVLGTVYDETGAAMSASLSWRTTAEDVAAVSGSGTVAANRAGHALIIASAGAVADTAHAFVYLEAYFEPYTVNGQSLPATVYEGTCEGYDGPERQTYVVQDTGWISLGRREYRFFARAVWDCENYSSSTFNGHSDLSWPYYVEDGTIVFGSEYDYDPSRLHDARLSPNGDTIYATWSVRDLDPPDLDMVFVRASPPSAARSAASTARP